MPRTFSAWTSGVNASALASEFTATAAVSFTPVEALELDVAARYESSRFEDDANLTEFEEAVAKLSPGGLSDPVVSRFGVHLIQLLDRRQTALDPKQLREQARNALREQKFQQAHAEWVRDLRSRAYVEYRDPPG